MISIDSQIWIYYYDPNAPENANVVKWLEGNNREGALFTEEIVLSTIIPMELAHRLYRNSKIPKDMVDNLMLTFLSYKNCEFIEINESLVVEALRILKNQHSLGVGGRDALILTTMNMTNVKTLITHDKNLLSLKEYHRLDPTFDPPLILQIGDAFNPQFFKRKLEEKGKDLSI